MRGRNIIRKLTVGDVAVEIHHSKKTGLHLVNDDKPPFMNYEAYIYAVLKCLF